jgi:hypothetical protein
LNLPAKYLAAASKLGNCATLLSDRSMDFRDGVFMALLLWNEVYVTPPLQSLP